MIENHSEKYSGRRFRKFQIYRVFVRAFWKARRKAWQFHNYHA